MSARSAKEYGTKKKKGEFAGIRYDLDKSSSSANNRVIKYQERVYEPYSTKDFTFDVLRTYQNLSQ